MFTCNKSTSFYLWNDCIKAPIRCCPIHLTFEYRSSYTFYVHGFSNNQFTSFVMNSHPARYTGACWATIDLTFCKYTYIFIIRLIGRAWINKDGSIRSFGLGKSNTSIIPVWLFGILIAILSYLLILYLTSFTII